MKLLPAVVPAWFPPTGYDGSNVQALWLTAMGWIEFASGSLYLIIHYVVPKIPRWEGIQITQESVPPRGAHWSQPGP
jgi:hypothetical protein